MISPFADVSVLPAYGKLQARIVWHMHHGFDEGKFIVFKSPDGLNDWREIGVAEHTNFFIDPALMPDGKISQIYYQVILQHQGKRYDSSVVGTLGHLTREEYGQAYFIMNLEHRRLKQCNKMLIFKLKTSARRCPNCVDRDTGQKIGIALCDVCFGTSFEGGFWPPVISFMQLLQQSSVVSADSQEGAGTTDPAYFKARMLAYPQLIKGDMIVDLGSDARYLVETQDVYSLKGKAPIISNVSMVLLRRSDVKYKVPLD